MKSIKNIHEYHHSKKQLLGFKLSRNELMQGINVHHIDLNKNIEKKTSYEALSNIIQDLEEVLFDFERKNAQIFLQYQKRNLLYMNGEDLQIQKEDLFSNGLYSNPNGMEVIGDLDQYSALSFYDDGMWKLFIKYPHIIIAIEFDEWKRKDDEIILSYRDAIKIQTKSKRFIVDFLDIVSKFDLVP